jgi:hypothetical protein
MVPTFTRRASREDVMSVARRLRLEDRQEVMAACGLPPEAALPPYIDQGREVWVAGLVEDNQPEIVYGLDPIPYVESAAVVWVLSTPRLYDYPVEFVHNTLRLREEWHARFELLTNYIDERNTRHIRWLKWMGFTIIRRHESFGAQSRPFLEFASYRPKD